MIPRDDLRVVAVIPYPDEFVTETIERALWWADDVILGDMNEDVDGLTSAWLDMESLFQPNVDDYVAVLYSGEVVVDSSAIRPAIRQNFGKRIGVTLHWMWDDRHYRTDWQPPRLVYPFFPYQPGAWFDTPARFVRRGPTYAQLLPEVGVPAGNLLAYRFSTPPAREKWAKHYERSAYEPYAQYVLPLRQAAQLEEWKHGGLM